MVKQHMKRCSTSLIIRGKEIKTTMRHDYLIPVRMAVIKMPTNINVGEGVEKKESSYTIGGNVNWYNYYGEQYGGSLRKLKQNYHMIPLLGILSAESYNNIKKIHSPQWSLLHRLQNPRHGRSLNSTEDWIKKMYDIYTMRCYSAIVKNEIIPLQ